MHNQKPPKQSRPYAVLGFFVGGLVAALLPRDLPGNSDSLVRAVIVGFSTGIATAIILWFQSRHPPTSPPT